MAKKETASTNVTGGGTGRPGTMALHMTDAEYDALPQELKDQISRSPAPKDSIGYYFDRMVSELKSRETEEERQFNVKDVLLWCYQQSDNKVFKTQSVRTVLKKRLKEGQIQEAIGVAGRDKVYQVVV
jgi:hypothetical protein